MQALDSNIDTHTLMALAGIGSFLLGLPLEGALLFFLFHFAHVLESKFVSGAERSLEGLLDALPQKARKVEALADGSPDWSNQQQVRVDDVELGTLIAVKPGEVLPLDGTVVEGSALVGAPQADPSPRDTYGLQKCRCSCCFSACAGLIFASEPAAEQCTSDG